MKLISLETQGFKRLRNHTFNFTDGLNVIVGDNAAGKSTLLQAIECALYGATVVPGKKEHLITWGQKSWLVRLFFQMDDSVYEVYRTKSTAKLRRLETEAMDGPSEIVANGATPVTKAIEEMLGLNAKDYNLFMQSKQGETSGVLTFGAAALNRKVEEFSGISTIDDVQQLAQEDFRSDKANAEAYSVNEDDIRESEASLKAFEADLKVKGFEVEAAVQQLEAVTLPEYIKAPSVSADELIEQRRKVDKLIHRLSLAESELSNAENQAEAAKERLDEQPVPGDMGDLLSDLEDKSEAILALDKKIKTFQGKINLRDENQAAQRKLEQRLADLPAFDSMGEALADKQCERDSFDEEYRTAMGEDYSLAEKLKTLQSLKKDARCPTCGSQLSEHSPEDIEAEITELKTQKDAKAARVKELKQEVSRLTQVVRDIDKDMETHTNLEQELASVEKLLEETNPDLDDELDSLREERDGLAAVRAKLDEEIGDNEAAWTKYKRIESQCKASQDELEDANSAVSKAKARLDAAIADGEPSDEDINRAMGEWDAYKERVSQARVELSEAKAEVDKVKAEFKNLGREVQRVEGALQGLKDRHEKSLEFQRSADKAARLSKFLRERRAGYLQEVWDAVLGVASKQVDTASRGMVTRIVFQDGDFMFEEDGILAPVASASGAQKAHIGVAVRIGLSRALYGKDALIIFDEPTESMREHHATGLSSSLAGAASQCILITHREQDQDLAANVIEVAA